MGMQTQANGGDDDKGNPFRGGFFRQRIGRLLVPEWALPPARGNERPQTAGFGDFLTPTAPTTTEVSPQECAPLCPRLAQQ